jgi:hypothetical protein
MITKKLRTPIAAALAFLVSSSRWSDAEVLRCDMPMPKTVRVDLADSPMRLSTEISLKEMRQAAAGRHPGPIVGAYRLTIGYAADIDGTVQEVGPGRYCPTPQYVILRAQVERVIYVPREFAADDCLSALSRSHEEKHAQAQDGALENLQTRLLTAVNSVISQSPRDARASGADALAAFTKALQASVEELLNKIEAERARLNGAVDTPDELDRLRRACQGRALQD